MAGLMVGDPLGDLGSQIITAIIAVEVCVINLLIELRVLLKGEDKVAIKVVKVVVYEKGNEISAITVIESDLVKVRCEITHLLLSGLFQHGLGLDPLVDHLDVIKDDNFRKQLSNLVFRINQ